VKFLRVSSDATPQALQLIARHGDVVARPAEGDVVALGRTTLYVNNPLPVIQPRPLPPEQIAPEYVPGR